MLPDHGYGRGTLVEFVSSQAGDLSLWLSLHLVAQAMKQHAGCVVLVDPARELFAPALVSIGIPAERTILVHAPTKEKNGRGEVAWHEGYWAINQSLGCKGITAVWGVVPTVDNRWLRRFQLSAELGGAIGVFIRPSTVLNYPTWSDIQWQVFSDPKRDSHQDGWRCRLRLTRARTGTGQELELMVHSQNGELMPAVLAEGSRPALQLEEPLVSSPGTAAAAHRSASKRWWNVA